MRQKTLVQIHINVRPDQLEQLRRLMEEHDWGISELIRLAIDELLPRVRKTPSVADNANKG